MVMAFMRQWPSLYRERSGNASEVLAKVLQDGCRVFVGSAAAEPQHLVRTLVELLPRYRDVEIFQALSMGALPEDWSGLAPHARLRTFFSRAEEPQSGQLGTGGLHSPLFQPGAQAPSGRKSLEP